MALTLVPYAGPPFVRTLSVPIPRHLAATTLKLSTHPGHTVPREKAAPESLGDCSATWKPDVSTPLGGRLLSLGRGRRLPGARRRPAAAGRAQSIRQDNYGFLPQPFASERRHVIELPDFMIGSQTIEVTMRPSLH